MKKILILGIILIGIFSLIKKEQMIMVPDESIRFRVISASNSEEDTKIKELLVSSIMKNSKEIFESSDIKESRNNIVKNVDKIEKNIDKIFKDNNYNKKYKVNYGINYFPEKIYSGVKYNEGYYESLVITIDEGNGNNYWCVMFPPLCMIDETVNKDDIEYKFKILEMIEKFRSINN